MRRQIRLLNDERVYLSFSLASKASNLCVFVLITVEIGAGDSSFAVVVVGAVAAGPSGRGERDARLCWRKQTAAAAAGVGVVVAAAARRIHGSVFDVK